ncbi:DUF1294 domain-containing protein [Clostridium kluyveri]|uniref:DUF1294 domain-containing protein n=2 Tax=Clostridium kluyveri TaxID=1534 RepID=A5N2Q7_CLOK5|nr:DUF1294 domain-containing protein [Clostridium kluyveri]EDK35403.1 Hypothetical protein CKL_3400 [Clostridium kluyveri DSM 555]BAH08057.1 hypothetical protein CKR_3006 [Clostridium kluyveri NBRC 12016]
MKIFLYYILLVNIYGFILMYIDKNKSKKGKWRISENKLFITAILFGSLGIFLGMYTLRHKTKHPKFVIGIPAIIILQLFIYFKFLNNLLP